MGLEHAAMSKQPSRDPLDVTIKIGVIGLLVIACLYIVAPFAALMLWALILAVALYPLHRWLARRLGNRQGWAAAVVVLCGLLLIGGPTVMLGSSFASQVHSTYTEFENDSLTIPKPKPSVAEWPLVGEKVYTAWNAAATDLPAYVQKNRVQLEEFSKRALAAAASTAASVLGFLGALIIAGIMMAYGESGNAAMRRIITRFAGPTEGPALHNLSTATIRSVATGVLGVAFIQALLLGIGFIFAGVPAAGLLALIALLIGIVQLPALLISLPVIAYLWMAGDASTLMNIVFTVYLLVAGMADNVLKPLLLGRGVDAPMPVILIGALGGMVSAGIIGLFVGAVVLAVGYRLFMEWIGRTAEGEEISADQADLVTEGGPEGR
jgi:predicted PurR-regulated permease PerM